MDSHIINEKATDQDKIDFLEADVAIVKAQLETGFKIVGVILNFKDHPTAPTLVGHRASATYQKMDATDKQAINQRLQDQKRKLAEFQAKRTVNFSINKDEKNDQEKTNKKDS